MGGAYAASKNMSREEAILREGFGNAAKGGVNLMNFGRQKLMN